MPHIAWQVYVIVVLLLAASAAVVFMLLYRHNHKTNIETNLLLKQMRITSRMRGILDAQRSYIESIDRYLQLASDDWEHVRQVARTLHGFEMGEMRQPPQPQIDFSRLLADVDGG